MEDAVRRHITTIAARSAPDALQLAHRLHADCWPSDGADRLEPAALEWLRHRRPNTYAKPYRVCLCATGPCPICN